MPRRSERNKETAEKAKKKAKILENEAEPEEPPKKRTKNIKKQGDEADEPTNVEHATSIYDFKAKDINGEEVSLEKYKGHVCIIVNVASKCGHTKVHYEQLVEMYEKYAEEKGLKILAFPCNQFSNQEPHDNQKISEFVKKRNVTFDVFDKINVNGKNAHPLWKYLTSKIAGPKGNKIDWNFTKFIIDKEGKIVERYKPGTKPIQMVNDLEKYW